MNSLMTHQQYTQHVPPSSRRKCTRAKVPTIVIAIAAKTSFRRVILHTDFRSMFDADILFSSHEIDLVPYDDLPSFSQRNQNFGHKLNGSFRSSRQMHQLQTNLQFHMGPLRYF